MLAARRMMVQTGCRTAYVGCDTVTDAFNRADAGDGTLGSADTGQRWVNVTAINEGTWTTQGTTGNTAQAIGATDRYRTMGTLLDAGGNNQHNTLDGDADNDDSIGIWARMSADGRNGYHFFPNAYGSDQLFKILAGVGTVLWTGTSLVTPGTAFTARLKLKDNLLYAYFNGTLLSGAAITVDPDDAGGNCETDWTYLGLRQDHGGPGGSAPSQATVYTNTHWDNLSVVAP